MPDVLLYLAPVISICLFGAVVVFLRARAATIRITGFDYLWFSNLQRKGSVKLRRLAIPQKLERLTVLWYTILEKFVRKVKIEALRVQVWADRVLERIKEDRNSNTPSSSLPSSNG